MAIKIEAHGKTVILHKTAYGNSWSLSLGSRVRFGNWQEIEEDITYFLLWGCLPPQKTGWQ